MYTKTNSDASVVITHVPDEAFFTDGDSLYVKMPANSVYRGLACAVSAVSEACGPSPEREREADFRYKANVISGTEYVILSDIQRDMRQMKISLKEFVSAMATAESTRDGKDGDFHYPPYGSPFAEKAVKPTETVEDAKKNEATNEGNVSVETEPSAEEDLIPDGEKKEMPDEPETEIKAAEVAATNEENTRSDARGAGNRLFARVRLNSGEIITVVKAKNRENVYKEIGEARLGEESPANPISRGQKNNAPAGELAMTK